ncbi:hypothetical protein FOZ60_013944 [Perkinsus olseni]|uniref:Uncharacterized protein n=1 Tax=Perkinsus olseni TaxID=32597 RepID=A0A7J6P7T1_PEROL|nr:hypothetical protein FOZ60_013944 [Perkinsus olseni]
MTYWERSSGYVAGTIDLGISCQEYEEAEIKLGAAALQLLDEVPGRGRIESEEANEEDGRPSVYLTELKKEIAALEELNAQLRSKIAVLMNDSEEGQENHQQEGGPLSKSEVPAPSANVQVPGRVVRSGSTSTDLQHGSVFLGSIQCAEDAIEIQRSSTVQTDSKAFQVTEDLTSTNMCEWDPRGDHYINPAVATPNYSRTATPCRVCPEESSGK